MTTRDRAEDKLKGMLRAVGLPAKGSYNSSEVCDILGFGIATFWRKLANYEIDEHGRLTTPDCLDSFILASNRRVPYPELVAYLERNQSYQRDNAIHPDQLALFSEGD